MFRIDVAASDDDSERLSNLNSPDRTYLVSYSLDSYRPDIQYLDLDLEFSMAQKVVKKRTKFLVPGESTTIGLYPWQLMLHCSCLS